MNPQGKERATKSIRRWSRREVLAWGIAAAGAGTGRLTLAEERAAEANPAPDIRFGFTTYTWGKDWDIPTLIANCQSARVLGVELRTSGGYAHGVELEISAAGRREVQDRFREPHHAGRTGHQRTFRYAGFGASEEGRGECPRVPAAQPRRRQ